MRIMLWACRIFIFLFLLVFALKNTDPISVRFLLDMTWQAPLISHADVQTLLEADDEDA